MLFCKQCFIYDCHMHEVIHVPHHEQESPKVSIRNSCGPQCFLNFTSLPPSQAPPLEPWSDLEQSMLQNARDVFGNHFCNISKILYSKSCFQVYCAESTIPYQRQKEPLLLPTVLQHNPNPLNLISDNNPCKPSENCAVKKKKKASSSSGGERKNKKSGGSLSPTLSSVSSGSKKPKGILSKIMLLMILYLPFIMSR